MSRDLLLADVPTEVQAEELSVLENPVRQVADSILQDGLKPDHFKDRQSVEVLEAVLAVARQSNLSYDQASQFPGYKSLPHPLRVWLELIFLGQLGMSDYKDLSHRVAVFCYPHTGRLTLDNIRQDVGNLPIAVLHGNRFRDRILMRFYKPHIGEQGLVIDAKSNILSRNLAEPPGVTALLNLAASRTFRIYDQLDTLIKRQKKTRDEAFSILRAEALPLAQPKIEQLQATGIEYVSFPQAVGPRINICDSSLTNNAIYCLRIYRNALHAERLREQINALCRRYGTTRSDALSTPGLLGRDHDAFLDKVQQRRVLLRQFRTSGPIIPDYMVEFRTEDVPQDLREQAMQCDEESTILPADLINKSEDPEASYKIAMAVIEDWKFIAQWRRQDRQVLSLKFKSGMWKCVLEKNDNTSGWSDQTEELDVSPDEFADLFSWSPKPLVVIRSKALEPEDLQVNDQIPADFAASRFNDSRWR